MARKITHASNSLLEAPIVDSEDELEAAPAGNVTGVETLFDATGEDAGVRLDQFLVSRIPDVSRVRMQQLIEQGKVLVNQRAAKPSLKLRGTEQIEITGEVAAPPLKAWAEDIPLEVVFEDRELAVVNKPSGMVVHASNGSAEDPRNHGTLVNALMFRFNKLSELGGELRPGIVHRLDKETSGLMVVAKNDLSHRKLVEQFSSRQVQKTYLALAHNWPVADAGTVNVPIGRDPRNRTRMSTAGIEPRHAISHYKVLERLLTPYGRYSLIEVRIETGRTHQIRVHLSSIGHPIVGDSLYGAPALLLPNTLARERQGTAISAHTQAKRARSQGRPSRATLALDRNFLHAALLSFVHPKSGKRVEYAAALPAELEKFLEKLRTSAEGVE
jgi:23S rRNA pseudouridine1911/1915/1917 synthase